jgi:hypothetical protein
MTTDSIRMAGSDADSRSAAAGPTFTFSGTIAPTEVTAAYRLGLVFVAATMLLLPVLYAALIAAAGAAVWWHVTENTWILSGDGGTQWRLILYATPIVAGLVLMFFMVKPILARPSKRNEPLAIDADEEPILFAFINDICGQVRAPRPSQVQVDCMVNASASFRRGSLFGRDLVLTIGMPLAAGLSIRELGGVLAHEFGHFAQGGGMRLTAIVRGVNGWFARVVYERDEWDEKLERWSAESDARLAFVLVIARAAVWASRRVLMGLMLGGHAISCFMLRQMEYDADSYEVKIAGSDAFVGTSMRLRELNAAAQFAYGDVRHGLASGTLPANLPAFVVARRHHLPAEILAHLRDGPEAPTGVFDTHPSDADRVCAAQAAAAPGVLVGADVPAAQLFRDFDALSAAATRHHFEHDFGLNLGAMTLVETKAALRDSRRREESFTALQRFLGERFSPYRPLYLMVQDVERLGAEDLHAQLVAARDVMSRAEAEASQTYAAFDALETKRHKAFAAEALLSAGFSGVNAADFDLAAGTADGAKAAQEQALAQQRALLPALEAFESAAARRLSCALVLRRRSTGEATADGAMIDAANALAKVMTDLGELRRLDLAARILAHNAPASPEAAQTATRLRYAELHVWNLRETIRRGLMDVACPPEFAASPMTLAERCGLPTGGPYAEAPDVIDRALRLYVDIFGRLASAALQVEAGEEHPPDAAISAARA